ncbi:Phage head-tail joining protein [Caballeronia cordobensis]|uniref:Phage head-tail joining protein n=1 Tax=Caballeronia cordobensis TaxID=1353886 RepID=A0A158FLE2_CABCO|nr:head-tail adaptor protein [Caballeronia cordobensis]SAL20652.1 Phage head-tail joining protein [Caballeronia cordobensis]
MPTAGELNKLVKIRRWQDIPDAGFGIEQTFDAGFDVWAKRAPVSSGIFFGSMQVNSAVTDRFIVRRSARVTEASITGEHVVEHGGLRYRVKRTLPLDGDAVFVAIDAELLGAI